MGHTNETANVELSQFLGSDKPAWLVDYNGDMAKIDAYAYATKVKADSNESAITSVSGRVTTVENTISNTITPALNSATNNITTLQGNITTINSLIGNGAPTTTDQTIIGAINEINSRSFINLNTEENVGIFDNKTLYRKVLKDVKTFTAGVDEVIDATLTKSYVDDVVDISAMIDIGAWYKVPYAIFSASTDVTISVRNSGLCINASSTMPDIPYIVTAYYTKS